MINKISLSHLSKCNLLAVAKLHIDGINKGFISSLGLPFVTSLYEAVAEDKNSFGFAAVEDGEVIGFVAFSSNLSKLYKHVVLKKGFRFVFILARKMFSIRVIKKIFQNIFYPSKMKKSGLPDAELLSIVVSSKFQGRGLAKRLVEKGLQECKARDISQVKVLVAEENRPANKLYTNTGFKLHSQVESHGVKSNIYVADLA